jgi:hypothetical protein
MAYGCVLAVESSFSWGPVSEGFRVGISLDSRCITSGETLKLTTDLKNVSDSVLTITQSYPTSDYTVRVFDSAGKDVPLTDVGKRAWETSGQRYWSKTKQLAPGEDLVESIALDKYFDFTAPGVYTVKAIRGGRNLTEPDRKKDIPSGQLTFTVQAKNTQSPTPQK